MIVTRTREERVQSLAEQFAVISVELGGIQEIMAALGGEDGDMQEFTEALQKAQPYLEA